MTEPAPPDPLPNLENIQANILHGSRTWNRAVYLFYRIENVEVVRTFIANLASSGLVHNAAKRDGEPKRVSNINIAFTHRGLETLKPDFSQKQASVRDRVMRKVMISKFPSDAPLGSSAYDFEEAPQPPPDAAQDKAGALDDEHDDRHVTAFERGISIAVVGDNWPNKKPEGYQWPSDNVPAAAWWSGDPKKPWIEDRDLWPHLLVWVSAAGDKECERVVNLVRNFAESDGPVEIGYQAAEMPDDGTEHFGFVDGISQPAIEGIRPGNPGDGKLGARGWQGLKVGEFILGYTDEGYNEPSTTSEDREMKDGTYLVYQKIEQDVASFNATVADLAKASGLKSDEIAAKLMGRYKDGDPLVVPPGAPDPPEKESLRNDFTYGNDQSGLRCPIGSHVRRANPRDDLHFEGRRVNRHRIIRRGMPYGPPYSEGNAGADRGLIFIALNARIEDQFEFIQREWLNTGRVFRTGHDAEPIAGIGEDMRVVINGDKPLFHLQKKPFTQFRGGDYFFVPSISTLANIASGSFAEEQEDG